MTYYVVVPCQIKIIVESIAASCRECRTALIGGETAEMPDMYGKDDIDLAGFVVGLVDGSDIIKRDLVNKNDIIVGISSSGIHSNGFSLVRKIIDDEKLDLGKKYKWTENKTLSDLLLTPTKLYFKIIYEILVKSKIKIHGIAHITGGGFYENIKRVIPSNLDAVIGKGSWQIPHIFKVLQEMGNISRIEMFRVFNMGIGMALIASPDDFYDISSIASETGEDIYKIGRIASGSGNVIIAKG